VYHWSEDSDVPVRVRHRPNADITRAVIRHRARAVTVRLRFLNLKRLDGDQGYHDYNYHFATPGGTAGEDYSLFLASRPDNRQGSVTFYPADGAEGCAGIRRSIDFAADLVRIRLPRGCLGAPRWVRVMVLSQVGIAQEGITWDDNPHNDEVDPAWTRRLYRSG
jgi:hypothetical protein